MSNVTHLPAQSLYGQIRLTVTFARSGLREGSGYRADYRALAKRYSDDWRELNVFAQGTEKLTEYPADFHAALSVFEAVARGLRWMPGEPR